MCQNRSFPNLQAAGKSPTVLAYNYQATGGKTCTLSVVQHFIPLRLRLQVSWFILFQNPNNSCFSVHVAFTIRIFSTTEEWPYIPAKLLTRHMFWPYKKLAYLCQHTWSLKQGSTRTENRSGFRIIWIFSSDHLDISEIMTKRPLASCQINKRSSPFSFQVRHRHIVQLYESTRYCGFQSTSTSQAQATEHRASV